ncbi:hypothetical protein CANARDRAFT_183949, partial [[Candida] arabinofermentans NRRL YB-2248]
RYFKDAISSPEAGLWKAAMEKEMNSQLENHTWQLVDLPHGRRAIGCRYVFIIKE